MWPEVERQFSGLLARPGVIAAGLAALGLGGGLAYRARRSQRKRSRLPWRR